MKKTFAALFTTSSRGTPQPPKVLVKMGENHLYRGPNPLHSSEIGDYIAEMSEGQGTRSVHILVRGVKGSQLRYTKVGAPYSPGFFDLTQSQPDAFMKPMLDKVLVTGWTMYDLRELRDGFDSLGSTGEDVERLVFGYDFLILIPEVTPSVQIR